MNITQNDNSKPTINIIIRSKFAFYSLTFTFLTITYLTLGLANSFAQATFNNEFKQGALIVGKITENFDKVYVDDFEVKLTDDGYFVFGIYLI